MKWPFVQNKVNDKKQPDFQISEKLDDIVFMFPAVDICRNLLLKDKGRIKKK